MMKKIIAAATAAAMATSVFAMTAFAADALPEWNTNGGQAEVEGDAYVIEPTIEVELPGDLVFGINPLSLPVEEGQTTAPQIVSGDYVITNYSNVPVVIKASTKVTAGANVDLLDDAAYDETSGDLQATEGKKALWLVQLYPTDASVVTDEGVTLTVTDVAADDQKDDIMGQVLKAADTDIHFLLTAYGETNEKMNATCASGFKFGGAVDPNATFNLEDEKDQVKVTTLFTLNTQSANQVANNWEVFDTGYDATVVKATQ